MSLTSLVDVTEIKAMTIEQLCLYYASAGLVQFRLFEQGTNYKVIPVLRQGDKGNQRVVGYKLEGKFIILQNNYNEYNNILKTINDDTLSNFMIYLEYNHADINTTYADLIVWIGGSTVYDCSSYWEIDHSSEIPTLTITVQALMSKDLLNVATNKQLFQT